MKKNNKGFSLVELIIVIAIMAVLIGVLAPQYIRYVEKSKVSTDATTIGNIVEAINTGLTDEDVYSNVDTTIAVTITLAKEGSVDVTTGDSSDEDLQKQINLTLNGDTTTGDVSFSSKTYTSAESIVVNISYDPDTMTWKIPTASEVTAAIEASEDSVGSAAAGGDSTPDAD